jgi:hypothetical protein
LRKDYRSLIENELIEPLAKSANSLTLLMIIKLITELIELLARRPAASSVRHARVRLPGAPAACACLISRFEKHGIRTFA